MIISYSFTPVFLFLSPALMASLAGSCVEYNGIIGFIPIRPRYGAGPNLYHQRYLRAIGRSWKSAFWDRASISVTVWGAGADLISGRGPISKKKLKLEGTGEREVLLLGCHADYLI